MGGGGGALETFVEQKRHKREIDRNNENERRMEAKEGWGRRKLMERGIGREKFKERVREVGGKRKLGERSR